MFAASLTIFFKRYAITDVWGIDPYDAAQSKAS
jgi:hypothetical protein